MNDKISRAPGFWWVRLRRDDECAEVVEVGHDEHGGYYERIGTEGRCRPLERDHFRWGPYLGKGVSR